MASVNEMQGKGLFLFPLCGKGFFLELWWLRGRAVLALLLFPLNLVKWTKRIFIEKCRSNTVCEMRVAWVWLLRKASAGYCLPGQLLQAPAPWLPYMRDQGLPRCSGERRAQCEMGQPSPQNTHFLCMLGTLVGIQTGSVTQATPHLFLMESVAFSRGLWAPSDGIQHHNKFVPKVSLFRLRLFI